MGIYQSILPKGTLIALACQGTERGSFFDGYVSMQIYVCFFLRRQPADGEYLYSILSFTIPYTASLSPVEPVRHLLEQVSSLCLDVFCYSQTVAEIL